MGSALQLPSDPHSKYPGDTGLELDFVDQLVEETLGIVHKILLGLGLGLGPELWPNHVPGNGSGTSDAPSPRFEGGPVLDLLV